MGAAMVCPDCGTRVRDRDDLLAGRRVHRLAVSDARVVLDHTNTVTLWHCANCDLVIGVT